MAAMARVGSSLLLFGGRGEGGRALADTWLFDLSSSSWRQLAPAGATPPARKMHSLVVVGLAVGG